MATRSSPLINHSQGAPNVERAMLSVVIGIAIVSLVVSIEALLSGTSGDDNRKCAGVKLRARATSAVSGKSSPEVSGANRQGRHAIAVVEAGALPFALLPDAHHARGDPPRLALSREGGEGTRLPTRRGRDGDEGTGLDRTGDKSWVTFTAVFAPYSAPAGVLA